MAIIKNPNDIVDELVSDFRTVFGDTLKCVIMYGSAVTHEYRAGVSDINIAIVLDDNSLPTIARSIPVQKKWSKRNVSTPFYLTLDYICRSLDTYPIEFLDMQNNYRVLYGEDVLKSLDIKREHLRLQCERNLKGAALHLRTGYIESQGNHRALHDLLLRSMRHLLPVFKALLVLGTRSIPTAKADIIAAVEDLYHIDASVLWDAYNTSHQKIKHGYETVFDKYIKAVDLLINAVDAMTHEEGVVR